MDWKTNAPAFIKFVRDHQCPSFLEYGEYPFVTADEIKKALKVKASLSGNARPDAVSRGLVAPLSIGVRPSSGDMPQNISSDR